MMMMMMMMMISLSLSLTTELKVYEARPSQAAADERPHPQRSQGGVEGRELGREAQQQTSRGL
jgi:hypothetical protein